MIHSNSALRFLGMLALIAALVCLLVPAISAADDKDDQKLLDGAWKPMEANLGGNIIDAMLLETAKVVYEADKYTVTIGEKAEMGSYLLDSKKSPKTMDIFPTSGDNNGKTLLAIYQVEGDNLTICYSLTPTVRPEEFKPLSNTLLVVKYQRIKESQD